VQIIYDVQDRNCEERLSVVRLGQGDFVWCENDLIGKLVARGEKIIIEKTSLSHNILTSCEELVESITKLRVFP